MFTNKSIQNVTLHDSSIAKYQYDLGLKKITGFCVEMDKNFGRAVGAAPIEYDKFSDGTYLALVEMENPASLVASSVRDGNVQYEDLFKKVEVVTSASGEGLVTRPLRCDTMEGKAFLEALDRYVSKNKDTIFSVDTDYEMDTEAEL